jgi:hypothetical protein
VQSVGSKAGAYIGSWGTWMGEKRKTGWGRSASGSSPNPRKEKENVALPVRNVRIEKSPDPVPEPVRPKTQESYEENLFDAEAGAGRSSPGLKKSEALPPHPSKFHEAIDEPVAVPEAAVNEVVQSSKKWEETAPKRQEAHERASAVAKAVEAATATPISP